MNAPLYNTRILRLAASIPFLERLHAPMASAEVRSPVCGSHVAVDVDLDERGCVRAIGMTVQACALGQASAAVMGANVLGRSAAELAQASDELAAWLAGARDTPPLDWPGLDVFESALPHHVRHPAIRLSFEAAAQAAAQALRN